MLLFILKPVAIRSQQAYSLTLDELFRLGTENSLQLKAIRMQEVIAADKEKTAQTSRLPDIHIGATTGYIGQPTVFRKGLSQPVHPDMPDWSHNYNVEVTQPIYRGGKIHYTIERSSLEKQIATLNSTNNEAEIKLLLLSRYMDLFSLINLTAPLPSSKTRAATKWVRKISSRLNARLRISILTFSALSIITLL